jgi:hypothetical protein
MIKYKLIVDFLCLNYGNPISNMGSLYYVISSRERYRPLGFGLLYCGCKLLGSKVKILIVYW